MQISRVDVVIITAEPWEHDYYRLALRACSLGTPNLGISVESPVDTHRSTILKLERLTVKHFSDPELGDELTNDMAYNLKEGRNGQPVRAIDQLRNLCLFDELCHQVVGAIVVQR